MQTPECRRSAQGLSLELCPALHQVVTVMFKGFNLAGQGIINKVNSCTNNASLPSFTIYFMRDLMDVPSSHELESVNIIIVI